MIHSTESKKMIAIPKNIEKKLLLTLELEKYFKILEESFNEEITDKKWVEVNEKDYYFIPEDGLIIANPCKLKMSINGFVDLPRLKWGKMEHWIAYRWFHKFKDINPMIKGDWIKYMDINNNQRQSACIYCADLGATIKISDGTTRWIGMDNADGIKIPIYNLSPSEKKHILYFLIENKLNLFKDSKFKKLFCLFNELNEMAFMECVDGKIIFLIENIKEYDFVCDKLKQYDIEFNPDDSEFVEKISDDSFVLNDNMLMEITRYLLDCDKIRANMETYPEHILQDPESGHWDLWDNGNTDLTVNISTGLVARNPVYDALENKSGVVGIDFGTKSTVVTYRQSRADILPMRIGSGQFSRAVSKSDYENPTVMELRNVEKFMKDYKQYNGRPHTCWADLLISHEAAEQLKSEQSEGDTFASFFSELKQWASDKSRQVRLRDLQGNEINIPTYLALAEDDFDPIEIYAYYLGLFINNMVHKIYLRYKLSFPATVEKKVRDKILDSFTKGIKKSLPMQVLEDDKCMKIFKVEQGASEPAAYAITALYGYGFDPEDDDKYYYGIFDFGGGTTDFDFGVWSAEETEPENYDYQISHFGQGGDPYLGGENLLQILAYHVFIKNYDKLLKDKIVFIRPFGEKEIAGKDYLVCQDSQYAHFNQKRMMEKLRGVWEGDKETRELFESGRITLPLFTMEGEVEHNYFVKVDLDELDQLLEERIDKGVSQFFDALKNCFGVCKNQKDIHNVEGIHIFLAGNSSKSPIVYKVFKRYIDLLKEGLKEREGNERDWFKIYPPLGTSVSDEILSGQLNPIVDDIIAYLNEEIESSEDDISMEKLSGIKEETKETDEGFDISELSKPTGKTGVAYGLLNNRVRVVQNETEEIGFRYYIGQNRKKKFYCAIDKDIQKYNVWTKFCTASKEEFDIWFTRSATAPSNKMPIDQIGVYSETGFIAEPSSEKAVFIRLVSPTEIEYVIATEAEIENNTFADDLIERVSLQEKQ